MNFQTAGMRPAMSANFPDHIECVCRRPHCWDDNLPAGRDSVAGSGRAFLHTGERGAVIAVAITCLRVCKKFEAASKETRIYFSPGPPSRTPLRRRAGHCSIDNNCIGRSMSVFARTIAEPEKIQRYILAHMRHAALNNFKRETSKNHN